MNAVELYRMEIARRNARLEEESRADSPEMPVIDGGRRAYFRAYYRANRDKKLAAANARWRRLTGKDTAETNSKPNCDVQPVRRCRMRRYVTTSAVLARDL